MRKPFATVDPGELNQRIKIEQKTMFKDTNFDDVAEWNSINTNGFWAKYYPLSVNSQIASAATQSEVKGWFKIRYRTGIEPDMRILHKAKYHLIIGVEPDPDWGNEFLIITVSQGLSDGGF